MSKVRIAKIIAERDEISMEEAMDLVNECAEEILASDPWEADQIMADLLGLEPDYIMDMFEL